jgi:hypothetical protein
MVSRVRFSVEFLILSGIDMWNVAGTDLTFFAGAAGSSA